MALLSRIKKGLAGMAKRNKSQKTDTSSDLMKKESLGVGEVVVEESKFYAPQTPVSRPTAPERRQDLPVGYDQDKIVLQVRDPWWLHAYWEVRAQTIARLKHELKDLFYSAKRVLRVYDVSYIIFNGDNAHRFFDIQITEGAHNWYIDTGAPGRSWCVDLGLLSCDGRFITIIRSNTAQTPLAGPSWITDEEWMMPDDMFARLYGMGVGLGSSAVKIKGLIEEKRPKSDMTSGALSSVSSPVKKLQERGFWLMVNTELIVYGATAPDAQVTIQGKEIKLRPDGTFSLRFALPEGRQVIPVTAVSSDHQEERTITPIVTRQTR